MQQTPAAHTACSHAIITPRHMIMGVLCLCRCTAERHGAACFCCTGGADWADAVHNRGPAAAVCGAHARHPLQVRARCCRAREYAYPCARALLWCKYVGAHAAGHMIVDARAHMCVCVHSCKCKHRCTPFQQQVDC